ncbi:MAG: hypothetical protein ACFBSF_12105 [Leptolyngbyaceae cyanobacterium]
MKTHPLVAMFLLCLSLSFCRRTLIPNVSQGQERSNEASIGVALPRDPLEVTLQVEATEPEPQQLRIAGRTNLPDGFVMRVSACRMLVAPEEAGSEKFTRGSCGPDTYTEFQDVKVTEGRFIAWFEVPTVDAARQIQMDYLEQRGDNQWYREAVPWEFVKIEVSGYPKLQPDAVLQVIGGQEGRNLTGHRVRKHQNSFSDSNEAPYNYVTWRTNFKM